MTSNIFYTSIFTATKKPLRNWLFRDTRPKATSELAFWQTPDQKSHFGTGFWQKEMNKPVGKWLSIGLREDGYEYVETKTAFHCAI